MRLVLKPLAILLALAIGLIAGGNALSNASASSSSNTATSLSPFSSEAYRQLALRSLTVGEDQMSVQVSQAQPFARQAFARNGLDTEASAILALSQSDTESQQKSFDALGRLTRRGRLLNFGMMQTAIAQEDVSGALAALDRLLLLYTSIRSQLVPIMADYLSDESTLPAMREILENDPDWADALFVYRGGGPETMRNLGRLRLDLEGSLSLDPATDTRLLQNLVTADQWREAFAIYAMLEQPLGDDENGSPQLDWADEFPPFDWQLADERDFHARPDREGTLVNVRIDPGRGGEFARRLTLRPPGSSSIMIDHTIEPMSQLSDLSVRVTCVESEIVLAESDFAVSPMWVQMADNPCELVEIAFSGRAWSGRRGLAGELLGVRFAR